ncbi:MAG: hypothetical protein J6P41_01755 [Prevotella sp.]|nr:hypothetical protein [Prevotella sp.]
MKRISLLLTIMTAIVLSAAGQATTKKLTVYNEFKPSIIQLKDGRLVKQNLTNIFLKNSSLLYLQGTNTMEANMDNIVSVKFDDKLYVKIDTVLAYLVDSIGHDALYCATVIDVDAYQTQLRNNNTISNISWGAGGALSTTSMNLNTDDDYLFPLVDLFFYRINGQFVKCHERNLQYALNKEKKRIVRTFVTMDDFSWTDKDSLKKLLKALQ